ncbi:MAG: hypothetical protein M3Y87_25790 [Myxococcota bacterium]|nr:hypothetical protein [Myxococcota bacterium]
MGANVVATIGAMPRHPLEIVLCLALVVLAGCSTPAPSECSDCTVSEFCCLGVCTPFGASCGDAGPVDAPSVDAGVPDAPAIEMPDASDPCAIPEGVTSAESACVGDTRVSCRGGGERSCILNARVCVGWTDGDGVAHGSCVPPQETEICDPLAETRCEGMRIPSCYPSSGGPTEEPTPPGYRRYFDCLDHAPDASCQIGSSGPTCNSPSDVECDPEIFSPTCASYCALAPNTELTGVVRPYPCRSGERCVLNAFSFDRPAPHQTNMGKREPRQIPTAIRRLCGHPSRGPSDVFDQSVDASSASAPPALEVM